MLFMVIATWEPEKTDEVIKGRATEEISEGIKIIGEWVDLGSNRVFRLVEADDPMVLLAAGFNFSRIGNMELVPVIESEEALKLVPKS